MRILVLLAICGSVLWAAGPELHVTEAEGKKAAIEKPAPEYPMIARQLKVSGKVAVDVVVDDTGNVGEVRIVNGNPLLTKPVVDAVKKWRFKPFQEQGKAAAAIVSLTFEFGTR